MTTLLPAILALSAVDSASCVAALCEAGALVGVEGVAALL